MWTGSLGLGMACNDLLSPRDVKNPDIFMFQCIAKQEAQMFIRSFRNQACLYILHIMGAIPHPSAHNRFTPQPADAVCSSILSWGLKIY